MSDHREEYPALRWVSAVYKAIGVVLPIVLIVGAMIFVAGVSGDEGGVTLAEAWIYLGLAAVAAVLTGLLYYAVGSLIDLLLSMESSLRRMADRLDP